MAKNRQEFGSSNSPQKLYYSFAKSMNAIERERESRKAHSFRQNYYIERESDFFSETNAIQV